MSKPDFPSSDDSYRLWPHVRRVSKCQMQPTDCLEPPDDTFATLYALGFRKPGYSPPPSVADRDDEQIDEQTSQSTSPPVASQGQPSTDTGTETLQADEPPTEEDYDVDIPDFDFRDE